MFNLWHILPLLSLLSIVSAVDDSDLDTILTRRIPLILQSLQGQTAAKSLCQDAGDASKISAWLNSIGSDGKWPDNQVNYTAGCPAQRANWPAACHWQRTATLAGAWVGPIKGAENLQNDPKTLAAAQKAMDWWFTRDFTNPKCIDSGGKTDCPCGTDGLWNTNWYANIIGVPTLVSETCLLLSDKLTKTQLESCSKFGSRTYGTFITNINGVGAITGANTLDIASVGIDYALLNKNSSVLQDAYNRIHKEVAIQTGDKADGIRSDGSFGQHAGVLYNGNYGKDYTNDVLKLEIAAAQTSLEASTSSRNAFSTLMAGYQWMTYLNTATKVIHWDLSAAGRFISFPVADNQATSSIQTNITQINELGQQWNDKNLQATYTQLNSKSSTANIGNLKGVKAFYTNDYMVYRGDGFVTTIKGYSKRTKNTECVNSQNLLGFHLSDGTLYTLVNGQEYEDISAAWDWNLIPGTTTDYGATELKCDTAEQTGIETFVGGASTGSIGIFAMKYTNPITKQLKWQKSWFFFRNGHQHVLVSNIESSSGKPVYSVLDQKRHKGDVIVDGRKVSKTETVSHFRSLWHSNVGYIFPESNKGVSLNVRIGKQTGSWAKIGTSKQPDTTVDLFAAFLEHKTPDAKVEYTAIPGVSAGEFQRLQKERRLETIKNDKSSAAVLDNTNNELMAVYWEAGIIEVPIRGKKNTKISMKSNQPILVIVTQKKWEVTVSDPSQTLKTVTLEFSTTEASLWGGAHKKTLTFDLPQGDSAGKSVSKPLFGNGKMTRELTAFK